MGFFRILFLILIVYWIFKAFQRIIAPFFQGYYGAGEEKQSPGKKYHDQGKVIIDTSKSRSHLSSKPDISKIEAEDVDFEEIK